MTCPWRYVLHDLPTWSPSLPLSWTTTGASANNPAPDRVQVVTGTGPFRTAGLRPVARSEQSHPDRVGELPRQEQAVATGGRSVRHSFAGRTGQRGTNADEHGPLRRQRESPQSCLHAGLRASQRRGRDLNPRSALRRITVFETA